MQPITETFIELNKVSTKVSTIGKKVGETFDDNENLVIIVPGNPGLNSFYDKFARRINDNLNCSVWCVGHAGHNYTIENLKGVPKYHKNKELYGLDGQVKNKVDFFEKYVPKNARVHLIGHSIGSYMAVELLDKPTISEKINKAYLLFPTIEYMAKTPNGLFLNGFLRSIISFVVLLSGLFAIFPRFIQTALLYGYMTIVGMPKHNCDIIRSLIRPAILKRVFFLAYEEMDQVLERNSHSLEQNIKKVKLLYGETDGWTPLQYYTNLKKDIPDIDAEVTSFNHAFVLNRSHEIGDMVCDWIKNKA
ncbi:unnamed protein product [Diabrotica balteata]|uniref:Lipid droplet-associated hydrolase n=1 Tax=Diabrotica balteata TaxID=107213 RepID=A0A9N9T088_DIABA|nr:unnamed protein product [Diabrotica balteata]